MNSSTNSLSTSTYYNEYKDRMMINPFKKELNGTSGQNVQNEMYKIYEKKEQEKMNVINEYKKLHKLYNEALETLTRTKNNYENIKQRNRLTKKIIIKQITKPQ